MIVLLPPSETKRAGGDGPAMELSLLGSGDLNQLREDLVGELVDLATRIDTSPGQTTVVAFMRSFW